MIWVSEPLVEPRRADSEPRFSPEVLQWCHVTIGSRWKLADYMCHVRITDPEGRSPPIENDSMLTLVSFDTDADEIAFRLRWM